MTTFLDNRRNEVRWAFRSLRRAPGTSALAVVCLALGIGANTAIFSLVNAVLLKVLPVESPHELYLVAASSRWGQRLHWNYPDYVAFRDRTRGFAGLAAGSGVDSVGLQVAEGGTTGPAELAANQFVSGNYFQVLGVKPALGRLFNAEDDRAFGGAPWAILSHDFWRSRFAADPRVIGRKVILNGYPLTVVGVAQRGFRGIDPTAAAAVFVPMVMHTEIRGVPLGIWNTRHFWWFTAIGRIPAGTPTGPIEAQLTSVFGVQEEEERKANPRGAPADQRPRVYLVPGARGWSFARDTLQTPLVVLTAVVGLVLLIACANVASIMLARGAARQREIAIRLAVGAGRARVATELLTESLVIAGAGGVAGVTLAYLVIRVVLDHFLPSAGWSEVSLDVSPDLAVLAFTIAVSLLTGILAGLAPGVQATRPDLVPALKEDVPGRPGSSRVLLRRLLVVTQVALSLLLLIGAALFVRSLASLRELDAGFRRERTLVVSVDPSRNGYKGQRLRDFYERLRAGVETLPGVRSVSLAAVVPLAGMRWNGDFAVEGYQFKPGEQKYVDMNSVGPRYFETMGIPLLLGREFRDEDNPSVIYDPPERLSMLGEGKEPPGPRVAIVTESFAKRFLAGGSPIGRRLSLTEEYEAGRAYEIVGVVRDARYFGLRQQLEPMVYLPTWRGGLGEKSLCVRMTADTSGLIESIRKAVRTVDPAVPVLRAHTMEEQVDTDIVQERLMAALAGFFGALALLLASVGLYGVISYLVTRRTREIGIRLALGEPRGSVLRLVIGDAAVLVGVGAAIGIAAAIGLSRLVRSLLFGISPQDPLTVAASVAVLFLVAILAVLGPVQRALRIHPSEALRYE